MNKTIDFYKSLQVRKGLSHIYKHPLVYSFKLENMVQAVVNTMVLRVLPELGITYRCSPTEEKNHHFVIECTHENGETFKSRIKYSSEELKRTSPLEIIIAAYAINPSLMEGVKSSPLIDDICLALHSEKENMK